MKPSILGVLGLFLTSATLPTDSSLPAVKDKNKSAVDAQLERWFDTHSGIQSPLDLKPNDFERHVKTYDDLTQAFLRLRYSATSGRNEKSALEATKAIFASVAQRKDAEFTSHPLYPYVLQEVIESSKSSKEDNATAYANLDLYGDKSCPRKDYFLKELELPPGKSDDIDLLRKRIDRIASFRSSRFRKEALQAFLDQLPRDKQDGLKDKLFPLVREHASILEDNLWLVGESDESLDVLKEPFKSLTSIGHDAQKQKCRTATSDLLDLVKKYKGAEYFSAVESAATKVESCHQRKGQKAREAYWSEMSKPLQEAYGFVGGELARRKLALLRWARDDFSNAKREFLAIVDEANKLDLKAIEANALFTLARIEENEGRLEASLEYYQRFANKYPSDEKFIEAEMAMVLINNVLRRPKEALANADAIVQSQSKLTLDKRNTGAMSFALFWSGRLQFALGQKAAAFKSWERVASEYYSTFYGALGHYVMEKANGKALVLSPARTVSFDPIKLYAGFSAEDQPTAQRISHLLRLGMRDEALCEIAELDTSTDERLLAKALFQYGSGEWLAAIKSYDALPRSFRNSLAPGFERLLFPRSYETTVQDYAKRIGVDPDLIFAIIRQESVFNPKANSIAGARGLMQLVPGTARGEAKRLSDGYVDKHVLQKLKKQLSAGDSSLFDADTNIVLGVHHVYRLLKKYNNPIHLLTSYNANPRATERWIQNLPSEDFLSFIERIPYAETRQYVKLVLRNYFYYKRWYSGPSLKMEHLEEIANASLASSH